MHAGIRRQPEKSKSQAVTVFVCGEGKIKYIMLTRRALCGARQGSRSDNERIIRQRGLGLNLEKLRLRIYAVKSRAT